MGSPHFKMKFGRQHLVDVLAGVAVTAEALSFTLGLLDATTPAVITRVVGAIASLLGRKLHRA